MSQMQAYYGQRGYDEPESFYWLKRVCAFAQENNRIPIFWDDMPFLFSTREHTSLPGMMRLHRRSSYSMAKGTADLDSLLKDFQRTASICGGIILWQETTR